MSKVREEDWLKIILSGEIRDELPDKFIQSNIFKDTLELKGYTYNNKEYTYTKDKIKIFITEAYNKKDDEYKILIQSYDSSISDEVFESIAKDVIEIIEQTVREKIPYNLTSNVYDTDKEYEYTKFEKKEKKKDVETEEYIFPLSEITYKGYIASRKPIDTKLDEKIEAVKEEEFDDFLEVIRAKVVAKEFCRGIPSGYINLLLPKVDVILLLSRQLIVKRKDKDKIIEKVIGFALLDLPTSSKKPLYLHLICTEKGYKDLGKFLMDQVKLIAGDSPILLHSVVDLPTYYKEKHGFKVIQFPEAKKKWHGLTPMLYGNRKKNKTNRNNKKVNSTRKAINK